MLQSISSGKESNQAVFKDISLFVAGRYMVNISQLMEGYVELTSAVLPEFIGRNSTFVTKHNQEQLYASPGKLSSLCFFPERKLYWMAKRVSGDSIADDSDISTPDRSHKLAKTGGKLSNGLASKMASQVNSDNEVNSGVEDDENEDLEYDFRSDGQSTDTAGGGSDYGEDSDNEAQSTAVKRRKQGKASEQNKSKTSIRPSIVLSSSSKALYTLAAQQPGSVAQLPSLSSSDSSSLVSSLFPANGDAAYLPLKVDHPSRPLYITPSTPPHIILEAFHPLSLQAQDFLTAIAEPVSRPKHVHEYKLTKHSLYAAVSIGLEPEDIIGVLSRLSKVKIPPETIDYIREATKSFGKVRLVLKDTKYYVESGYADTLRLLLRDQIISKARAAETGEGEELETATMKKSSLVIPGTKYAGAGATGEHVTDGGATASEPGPGAEGSKANGQMEDGLFTAFVELDADEEADDDDNVHRFQIKADEVENVKKRCNDLEYPMLQEYDFRADSVNPNLEIALKPATQIRPYQEKSLRKMFSNEYDRLSTSSYPTQLTVKIL